MNPANKIYSRLPANDKDFELIFEDSFKFEPKEDETMVFLFDEINKSESQNDFTRKNSSDTLYLYQEEKRLGFEVDVIEQFLGCNKEYLL